MSTDVTAEYPWLAVPWQRLCSYLSSGRMPPALLLTGKRGLGKTLLAKTFAQRLLCRDPASRVPCGHCEGCRLVAAGTHPDFLVIEPEETGKPIKVEAIRALIARLALRTHFGGYRVVLMVPAHLMNRHAANSVLKTLEEPDAATVFLLVTEAPEVLPVTVRSRCQTISMALPARTALIDWLRGRGAGNQAETVCAIAGGAPFPAMELLNTDTVTRRRRVFESWAELAAGHADPVSAAATWEKSADDTVHWVAGWVEDLIRIRHAPDRTSRHNPDLHDALARLAPGVDVPGLFRYQDLLGYAKRSLTTQINRQFLMEELAIHWSRIGSKS